MSSELYTAFLLYTNYSDDNVTLPRFEKGMSSEVQVGLTFLYTLTILASLLGNISVILVFTCGRRCKNNLFGFLLNLAVADIIMAVFCMPFTFSKMLLHWWIYSEALCPIVLFLQIVSVSSSIYTQLAIGIDRFLAIRWPLKPQWTRLQRVLVVCGVWLAAIGVAAVQLYVGRVEEAYSDYDDTSSDLIYRDCREIWEDESDRKKYTVFILCVTYLIPLFILTTVYIDIGRILSRRAKPGGIVDSLSETDRCPMDAKRKVIKMLVIVLVTFCLCWLPLHVYTFVLDFVPQVLDRLNNNAYAALFCTVHWIAMSSTFTNPIIYSFLNPSFQADLFDLFCKCRFPCCVWLRRKHRELNSMRMSVNPRHPKMRLPEEFSLKPDI